MSISVKLVCLIPTQKKTWNIISKYFEYEEKRMDFTLKILRKKKNKQRQSNDKQKILNKKPIHIWMYEIRVSSKARLWVSPSSTWMHILSVDHNHTILSNVFKNNLIPHKFKFLEWSTTLLWVNESYMKWDSFKLSLDVMQKRPQNTHLNLCYKWV